MLDSQSIEVISKFKQSLLTKSLGQSSSGVGVPSRANKRRANSRQEQALVPKVVEYDGAMHLVLTNESLESSNYRARRKWKDAYGRNRGRFSGRDSGKRELEGCDEAGDENGVGDKDDDENGEDGNSEDDSIDRDDGFDRFERDEISEDEEEHPFKKLKLTEILAPLSHPSEVVTHPAILRTYELPVLKRLADELIEVIELEQNNLNWLNKLLQVLNGEDWFYLLEENLDLVKYDHGLIDEGTSTSKPSDAGTHDGLARDVGNDNGISVADSSIGDSGVETSKPDSNADVTAASNALMDAIEDPPRRITRTAHIASIQNEIDPFFALPGTLTKYDAMQLGAGAGESTDELRVLQEDLINYLQVSIQRQQEYIKNLTQIRNGLVRADRLKHDLFKWGKEMNDKNSS